MPKKRKKEKKRKPGGGVVIDFYSTDTKASIKAYRNPTEAGGIDRAVEGESNTHSLLTMNFSWLLHL